MSGIAEDIIGETAYIATSLLEEITTETRASRATSTNKRRCEATIIGEEDYLLGQKE